jgi:hypothetical protein
VEGEGSSADGRGTGRVHDKRGAKRSGCVSAGIPQIDPIVSAHQETSEPRHRLTCGGCATLCDAGRPPSSWASAAVVADHESSGSTGRKRGVFTTHWSATVTYRRALGEWGEFVCAENTREYYAGKDTVVPTADKPDF